MRIAIDLIVIFGMLLCSVGVYLNFGLGYGFMCAGVFFIGFGLLAARAQGGINNVSDSA